MQLSHAVPVRSAVFDDLSLVSCAGLVPAPALAHRAGLEQLAGRHLTVPGAAGVAAGAKVAGVVAGMVAGADSITDLDLLRHGGMGRLFTGVRAPSTLGTFLRAFTHGHVQQLNAVLRQSLINLAERTPLLPGAEQVVLVDLDSTHRQVYGYAKQGGEVGRLTGKKTLHPLLVTASTPIAAPVVVAVRMRRGKAADVRGAPRLLAEALTTVRALVPTATIIVRGDSKFYTAEVVATAARYGAAVSLTTGANPSVHAAIAQIPDTAWRAIHYPNAFVDQDTGQLVSDAEVAEIGYTAFTSGPKKRQARGRLVVRRVKRLGRGADQDGLFDAWRYHAVFVTSDFEMLQAEACHRDHAVVEQLIADGAASALAHLPSGSFNANAAWAVLWAIAHNLTRATGVLASAFHARATTPTIRAHLINVPARLARHSRRLTLHLPQQWPWEPAWHTLHAAIHRPHAA
jgi:hypothetical protein